MSEIRTLLYRDWLEIKRKYLSTTDIKMIVFDEADEILSYGRVVEVMAVITSAGFNKIALVTDFEINK